jgi:hypothetical protein
MKRQITVSLVLTVSLLLLLQSFPATAQGQQPPGKFSAYSGMVTLGTGQVLRVTVAAMGNDGNEPPIRVRFRWAQYMAVGCSGMPQVCRHTVAAQGLTVPETLGDDAVSFDVPGTGQAVNVTVQSNSRNVRVLGVVFDTSTQRIVAICTFIPD